MEFLKKLGWRKLSVIGVSTLAVLICLGVLIFNLTTVTMVPLFSHLSKEDSNIISIKLSALGVPIKFSGDNTEILVPADKVLSLRMYLAQEGLPASGSVIGYEIFDKESALGTSQFVNNINLTRALEGELARTISSIAQVESARVHLVLPKKELFSRINNEPSASIVIKVKNGKTISKSEVIAITNLVSSAVSELTPEKVTIVDTKGHPLKIMSPDGTSSYSDSLETSYC